MALDPNDPRGPDQRPGALNTRGQQTAPPTVDFPGTDHSQDSFDPRGRFQIPGITPVSATSPVTSPIPAANSNYTAPTGAIATASRLRPYDVLQQNDDRYDFRTGEKVENNVIGSNSSAGVPNSSNIVTNSSSSGSTSSSTSSGSTNPDASDPRGRDQIQQTRIINTPSGPQEVVVNNSEESNQPSEPSVNEPPADPEVRTYSGIRVPDDFPDITLAEGETYLGYGTDAATGEYKYYTVETTGVDEDGFEFTRSRIINF